MRNVGSDIVQHRIFNRKKIKNNPRIRAKSKSKMYLIIFPMTKSLPRFQYTTTIFMIKCIKLKINENNLYLKSVNNKS